MVDRVWFATRKRATLLHGLLFLFFGALKTMAGSLELSMGAALRSRARK